MTTKTDENYTATGQRKARVVRKLQNLAERQESIPFIPAAIRCQRIQIRVSV